jgi:hypothetical protein
MSGLPSVRNTVCRPPCIPTIEAHLSAEILTNILVYAHFWLLLDFFLLQANYEEISRSFRSANLTLPRSRGEEGVIFLVFSWNESETSRVFQLMQNLQDCLDFRG